MPSHKHSSLCTFSSLLLRIFRLSNSGPGQCCQLISAKKIQGACVTNLSACVLCQWWNLSDALYTYLSVRIKFKVYLGLCAWRVWCKGCLTIEFICALVKKQFYWSQRRLPQELRLWSQRRWMKKRERGRRTSLAALVRKRRRKTQSLRMKQVTVWYSDHHIRFPN